MSRWLPRVIFKIIIIKTWNIVSNSGKRYNLNFPVITDFQVRLIKLEVYRNGSCSNYKLVIKVVLIVVCLFSQELAHLPEPALSDPAFGVSQLAKSVSAVGEPLTFVDVSARPGENAETAHVTGLPLAVITLGPVVVEVFLQDLPSE